MHRQWRGMTAELCSRCLTQRLADRAGRGVGVGLMARRQPGPSPGGAAAARGLLIQQVLRWAGESALTATFGRCHAAGACGESGLLVVEDMRRCRDGLVQGLRQAGWQWTRYDGAGSAGRLARRVYEVSVLDRDLPVVPETVCRAVDGSGGRGSSAHAAAGVDDRVEGLETGALRDNSAKPFALARVVARVRARCPARASMQRSCAAGDLTVDEARHRTGPGSPPAVPTRRKSGTGRRAGRRTAPVRAGSCSKQWGAPARPVQQKSSGDDGPAAGASSATPADRKRTVVGKG